MSRNGRSLVTLGKVQTSRVGPHTLLQITGLDGVLQNTLALMLPPGYTARPAAGADVALLEILGSSDHVVAVGGGKAGQGVANLQPGEFGFSDGTSMVIMRLGGVLEVKGVTEVKIDAPTINITSATAVNITAPVTTIQGELRVNGGPIKNNGIVVIVP